MQTIRIAAGVCCLLASAPAAQEAVSAARNTPIYTFTVEQRSISAVNYSQGSGPTKIDFKGTVLDPKAHGEAAVESGHGAVKIDAKFKDLPVPTKFGPQFLTYVLWAITPDGRANNLGEIITNYKDNCKLAVTTPFPAFGLIVTAEPYFSVTIPSDVVVLENAVRPGTAGTVEQIEAKYQLLPRSSYTLNISATPQAPAAPMVTQSEYDALLALYEAQNAVQIAKAARADVLAPDVFQKATDLMNRAQGLNTQKADSKQVVTTAREAAQTAEDAREIAVKKQSNTE